MHIECTRSTQFVQKMYSLLISLLGRNRFLFVKLLRAGDMSVIAYCQTMFQVDLTSVKYPKTIREF